MISKTFILSLIVGVNAGIPDDIIRRQAATTAAPTGGVDIFTDPACSFVGEVISICNSLSPGFTTLDPTAQAPCLCYSSTYWVPGIFDGAVATCADFVSSAAPQSLTDITGLESFCTDAGNVLSEGSPGAGGGAASSTTSPAASTASPAASTTGPAKTGSSTTGGGVGVIAPPNSAAGSAASATAGAAASSGGVDIFTNPGCSFVGEVISICNSLSPGFTTLDPTAQAPCLCYSSTDWVPSIFDGAVATCADFVSSAAPQSLTDITALESFCTDAGNVLSEGGAAAGSAASSSAVFASNTRTTTRHTSASKTQDSLTFATPTQTTIQSAPTTQSKPGAASSLQNGVWSFGIAAIAMSMIILA